MRILFLSEYLAPQRNGIATRCENYISHLRGMGHDVTVFGPTKCPTADYHFWTMTNWLNKENSICFPTLQLIYTMWTGQYDVIHIVYPPAFYGVFVLVLAYLMSIRVVVSNHVNMNRYKDAYLHNAFARFIGYIFAKYLIYYPQLVFCQPQHILSPIESEDMLEEFNFTTQIAPSGVDTQLFTYDLDKHDARASEVAKEKPRPLEIVCIGRVAPEKNMIRLFELIECVATRHNGFTLKIVGPGPDDYVTKCKEYVAANPILRNIVTFVGPVSHYKLAPHYQSADIFITCSVTETFGFANMEALACGTPIIYPRCQAFSLLYESEFPYQAFDLNNNETFIKALDYVVSRRYDLRAESRQFVVDHWSWQAAAKKLAAIYADEVIYESLKLPASPKGIITETPFSKLSPRRVIQSFLQPVEPTNQQQNLINTNTTTA